MDAELPTRRLLFAVGGLGRGGAELQLARLLRGLAADRGEITLLLLHPGHEALRPCIEGAGIRVLVPPVRRRGSRASRTLDRVAFVIGTLRRERPELLYAWLDEASLWLVPWGILHRLPVLVARRNLMGSRAGRRFPLLGRVHNWLERRATIVTANSDAVASAAAARGIARSRIRVIANGHPPVAPLPFPEGPELVLGYLANFRPGKGHDVLLGALREIAPRTGWRVLMAGAGPLAEPVAAELRRLGLAERVEVTYTENARRFWARCDAAVLLSDSEGSPNTLIEAAFAGRPMLATDAGGTVDIVAPGTGWLVPPRDVPAATAALRQLLDSTAEARAAMGRRAHEHASTRFALEAMVDGHRDALRSAAALRRGTGRP